MEYTQNYSSIALCLVAGKLTHSYVSKWWNARKLRDVYIELATDVQVKYEIELQNGESEEETTTFDTFAKVDLDKKIPRKHHGLFRNHLVRVGKAKFGTHSRSEANRLVIRKYLHDECEKAGLMARHIHEHLDIATALVFVPSKNELIASAIQHTELSKIRSRVHKELEGDRPTVA
jgi:hypothetical protein